MTIPVSDRLSQLYVGNGTNKRFDFTFRVFQQEDETGISIRKKGAVEFETLDPSTYVVQINQDDMGGYVTFNTAPESGTYFYIAGTTSLDQLLDITNYDNFYPDAIERALDKLTALLQERITEIDQEKQSRILADLKYDALAMEREDNLENRLTSYINAMLGITNPAIFDGISDRMIITKDGRTQREFNESIPFWTDEFVKFMQETYLREEQIIEHADSQVELEKQRAIIAEASLESKIEVEKNRALGAEAQLNLAIGAVSGGYYKSYATLASANADIANIPLNVSVKVLSEMDGGDYYKATANATSLTKSPYDALTLAKQDSTAKINESDENIIRALHGRFGVTKNLLTAFSASSNSSVLLAILRWSGAAIATNGIFGAVRLSVVGANYPSTSNDPSVFNSPLRLQGFAGSTLVFSRDLTRLSNSDVWYHRDKTLFRTDITEIKIVAYPASGVTISFENAVIQNDAGFGNPEIDARNTAIAASKKLSDESIIASLYTADTNNRALVTDVIDANTIQQIYTDVLTENLQKVSVGCVIECDGAYPEAASSGVGDFGLRAEILNSSNTVLASFFLKRIANTKIWYLNDVDISAYSTNGGRIKLFANVPPGSTVFSIKRIIISDKGLPQPLYKILKDAVSADVVTTATSVAQNVVNEALSGANLGWPTTAFDAIGRASSRRVDIVGIGDSNQLMDGYGFDGALRKALSNRFGIYATKITSGLNAYSTGAGAELAKYAMPNTNYIYVPEGSSVAAGTLNGIYTSMSGDQPLDAKANLRCHYAYGTFASGAGSFRVGVRREESPYTGLINGSTINTNTGSESYILASLDIPANASRANWPLSFKWVVPGGTAITGPFIGYFMRLENIDLMKGISFTSLYGAGGKNLLDMANVLLNFSNFQLTNFFTEIRRLQIAKNQKPIVVVYINSGLNDRGATVSPSLGWRASTVPDSPTAYLDNLEVLTKRIMDIWQYNKWDERELYFWINPSHPVSSPDDSKLKAYRKAAYTFAGSRSRVSVVDFENIISSTEIIANNWYKKQADGVTNDTSHLTSAGYDAVASRLMQLIP